MSSSSSGRAERSRPTSWKRRGEPPCAEWRPEDGLDPRRERRAEQGRREQKDRRLCKEVLRQLSLALAELAREEWAAGLAVVEVQPAPDASRLKVMVTVGGTRELAEALELVARLQALEGALRWEIATVVARRRVPELHFELAPGEVGHG